MPTFITHKPLDNISVTGSEFGRRVPPKDKASDIHLGIDFPVPAKTQLYAAHSGKITKLRSTEKGGNTIEITADDGSSTTYLHLDSFDPRIVKDQRIYGGDKIGLSGDTGTASSGPHLHFVVKNSQGIAENPRLHLAERFREEFSSTVNSGRFGIELTGDDRANLLIGNARANIADGGLGFDTYSIGFGDTVNDTDFNGRLVVDSGSSSTVLEGNALPKIDADGNYVEGSWVLNGFELVRRGANLLVFQSGSDSGSEQTPRITINNFPFDSDQIAFGISLGKVPFQEYDSFTKTTDIAGSSLFPTKNKSGYFIAAAGGKLCKFDSAGNKVGIIAVTSVSTDYTVSLPYDYNLGPNESDKQALVAFRTADEGTIGIARLDVGSGKIVASSVMAEGNDQSSLGQFYRGYLTSWGHDYFLHYQRVYSANTPPVEYNVQKFDRISLAAIGDPLVFTSENYYQSGLFGGFPVATASYPEITLGNGARVSLHNYNSLQIFRPKLRNIEPSKVSTSLDLTAGQKAELPPAQSCLLLTFRDGAEVSEFTLTPTTARIAVLGTNGEVNLSQLDIDEADLAEGYSAVTADEFSMQDLLNGEYNPPQHLSRHRRDAKESSTDPDDDYYEEPTDTQVDEIDLDSPEVFSILTLRGNSARGVPYNIQLIFPGISQTQFQANIPNLFSGYAPPTLPPTPGNPGDDGRDGFANNPMAISLVIGGVVVAVVASTVAIYKFVTDEDFRTRALHRIDPRNWFRQNRVAASPTHIEAEPEALQAVAVVHETALDNPLADPIDINVITNELREESAAPSRSASIRRERDSVTRVIKDSLQLAK